MSSSCTGLASAAALPVCGGGDPNQAEKLARLPIWAFHGDEDPLVPVERSRDMIAAIRKARGKPKYTEYKGVGHDSWTKTYRNDAVLDWLFRQRKSRRNVEPANERSGVLANEPSKEETPPKHA